MRPTIVPAFAFGVLLISVLLLSGCATYRVPPMGQAANDSQRKVCDEFARGEVARLGESMPKALARGILIGFILDLDRIGAALHYPWTADYPDLQPYPGERPNRVVPDGAHPQAALLALPWSLIGGPQLARDAARTNEDVYEQAVQTCMAPMILARELGPVNARVATSLELLANCYAWQRRYAQAEPLRRQALAIWETVFGPNDPRVATALVDYATLLRSLHRVAEADTLTGRAEGIRAQLAPRTGATTLAHSVDPRCGPDTLLSAAIRIVLCQARVLHDTTKPGTP